MKPAYLQYMDLGQAGITFFTWEHERFSVRYAPVRVFNLWVRQYLFEERRGTTQWDMNTRWYIINELLKQGDLVLLTEENGTLSLRGKTEMVQAAKEKQAVR